MDRCTALVVGELNKCRVRSYNDAVTISALRAKSGKSGEDCKVNCSFQKGHGPRDSGLRYYCYLVFVYQFP